MIGRASSNAAGALVAISILLGSGLARAFTISTVVTTGCHEKITTDALRAVRLRLATAAPLAADRNDQALIDDLQFSPASDVSDLGGVTLLLGVRDNDLKGRDSSDLSQLAIIQGDPGLQKEHCLRGSHQMDPGGSEAALVECRAFIVQRVREALDGLSESGQPDPAQRTSVSVFLSLRHHVDALLPTYYLRMGQAIHALEDSFAHTYRTDDAEQITAVLDWVDQVNGTLDEERDGPGHTAELDRCDDPDPLRQRRRELATEAAEALLSATLEPNQTTEQQLIAANGVLDTYFGYMPGCDFSNGWCQAPEQKYSKTRGAIGCAIASERPSDGVTVFALGLLATVTARRRGRRASGAASIFFWVTFFLSSVSSAHADAAPSSGTQDARADGVPPPQLTPVPEPGPTDRSRTAWGAYLGGSGSVSYEALAATAGLRLRVSPRWTFGLDAEWNPWIAVNGRTALRAGAFNAYGTAILRVPLAYEKFNLRVSGNLGISRLLIDLYGVPKGSTGLFLGINPLGMEWKASRAFYLIIVPLGVAIPIPQLTGIPFSYPQYRATIGVEVY